MHPQRPSSASSSQGMGRRYAAPQKSSSISHYQIIAKLSDREDILAALHHGKRDVGGKCSSTGEGGNYDTKTDRAKLRHGGPEEINQFQLIDATSEEKTHCRDLHNSVKPHVHEQVTPGRGTTPLVPPDRGDDVSVTEYRFVLNQNRSVNQWFKSKEKIEESEMSPVELLEKRNRESKQQRKSVVHSAPHDEPSEQLRSNKEFVSSLAAFVAEVVVIEQLAADSNNDGNSSPSHVFLLNPIKELLVHPPSGKGFLVRTWPQRSLRQFLRELTHDTQLKEEEKQRVRIKLVKETIRTVSLYHSMLGMSVGRIHPDHLQVIVSSSSTAAEEKGLFSLVESLLVVPTTLAHTNWSDDLEEVDFSPFFPARHSAATESPTLPSRPSQLNRFEAGCNEATARKERRKYDWIEDLVDNFPGLCPPEALDHDGLGLQTTSFGSIDSWQLGRLCQYVLGELSIAELDFGGELRKNTVTLACDHLQTALDGLTEVDPFDRWTPRSTAEFLGLPQVKAPCGTTGGGFEPTLRIERHIEQLQKQIIKVLLSGGTTYVSLSTKFVNSSLAANSVDQTKVIEAATKELFIMECQSHFTRGVTPISEGETYKPSPRRIDSAERRLDAVERPSPSPFSPSRVINDAGITGSSESQPRPSSASTATNSKGTYASSTRSALHGRGRPASAVVGRPPLSGASPAAKDPQLVNAGMTDLSDCPYLSVTIQSIQCLKIPVPALREVREKHTSSSNSTSSQNTLLDTQIRLSPACLSLLKQSSFLRVDLSLFRPLPTAGRKKLEGGPQLVSEPPEEVVDPVAEDFAIKSPIQSNSSEVTALAVTVSVLDSSSFEDNDGNCSSTGRLNLQADPSQIPSFQPDGKLSLMVSVSPSSSSVRGAEGVEDDKSVHYPYQTVSIKLNHIC